MLSLTSLMAANADFHVQSVADWLAEQISYPVRFVSSSSWSDREALLDWGDVAGGWICGGLYVRKADRKDASRLVAGPAHRLLAPLAAPVMAAARYGERPIYFTDVVVRADSSAHCFADLRGQRWGYNETGSHSGHTVPLWHMARQGWDQSFFGSRTALGSHQQALRSLLAGDVDAVPLDSIVLETELRHNPYLASQIRTVAQLGPSPAPPWVLRADLSSPLVQRTRRALLHMHQHERGRRLLQCFGVSRFSAVSDRTYDSIRHMVAVAGEAA